MSPDAAPAAESKSPVPPIVRHEFHHLRKAWCWLLTLGILLVVCGTAAVVAPLVATKIAVDILAAILLIAGVATVVTSFWAGKWSGILVQLLIGVLYIVAGFIITGSPMMSILIITIFLAATFIVGGAFRAIAAIVVRFPQWGWALLNGLITMLLGIVIYRHLPYSALWVVGLLVGIEMLFAGWTWIMLALAVRQLPDLE